MKPPTRNDYVRYADAKRRLAAECTSAAEYERKLRELARKMNI